MPNRESERRIVICDASPLIFLSKTGGLELIGKVLPGATGGSRLCGPRSFP